MERSSLALASPLMNRSSLNDILSARQRSGFDCTTTFQRSIAVAFMFVSCRCRARYSSEA